MWFWGVGLLRSHARALVLTGIAVGTAGCSADTMRFGDGPSAARPVPNETTGSVPGGQSAPVGRVESTRLAAPSYASSDPGVSGGSRGVAAYQPPHPSYQPSYQPAPAATPAAAPASDVTGAVRKPASPQWTWDGGTAISVAQGDSVELIARRHGVPASAIMQANGLSAPAVLYPGQRLVIPRRQNASLAIHTGDAARGSRSPRPPAIAAAKPGPVLASLPAPTALAPAQASLRALPAAQHHTPLRRRTALRRLPLPDRPCTWWRPARRSARSPGAITSRSMRSRAPITCSRKAS